MAGGLRGSGLTIEDRPTGIRRQSRESRGARFHTLKTLQEAGIETALSAQDLRGENGLARQAMYALRYGVPADRALASVTSIPARLLGISERIGSLEVGRDADLVIWSGRPFAATSRVLVVLIDGQVVVDRRKG